MTEGSRSSSVGDHKVSLEVTGGVPGVNSPDVTVDGVPRVHSLEVTEGVPRVNSLDVT